MADPNRKINLDLPSDDDDSDGPTLDPSEISLVKEFEEEFKDRFTDDDQIFAEFCKQKPKPPPIVYPFDQYRGGHRGGHHRGGGRFQHYGNRPHYDNRRNYGDGQQRYNNSHHYNRNRGDHQQQPHRDDRDQHRHKRPRTEDCNQGGS